MTIKETKVKIMAYETRLTFPSSVLLSLVEGLLEYLEFPLLKFSYFQYSCYLFPKVFSCQIS